MCSIFFFKQKTAYEMRISDWSSDVCSSDLLLASLPAPKNVDKLVGEGAKASGFQRGLQGVLRGIRSEEHTSELQSLMRISYAVFCLKKKNKHSQKMRNPLRDNQ